MKLTNKTSTTLVFPDLEDGTAGFILQPNSTVTVAAKNMIKYKDVTAVHDFFKDGSISVEMDADDKTFFEKQGKFGDYGRQNSKKVGAVVVTASTGRATVTLSPSLVTPFVVVAITETLDLSVRIVSKATDGSSFIIEVFTASTGSAYNASSTNVTVNYIAESAI